MLEIVEGVVTELSSITLNPLRGAKSAETTLPLPISEGITISFFFSTYPLGTTLSPE